MSTEDPAQVGTPRERRRRRRGWALKVVLPSVIALAVGAVAATALPAGSSGTITACVVTNASNDFNQLEGSVRVINTATTSDPESDIPTNACASDESTLTWNQTGPAGPTGPQGTTGSQGAAGSQGVTGSSGAPGAPGAPGAAGPAGAPGLQGPAGAAGTTGEQGLTSYGPDLGPGEAAYLQIENENGSSALKPTSAAGYNLDTNVQDHSTTELAARAQAGGQIVHGLAGETGGAAGLAAVPINGFAFSVQNVTNIGSANKGAGAGKVTFNPLVVTRAIDASSPTLFLSNASGTSFKQMVLSVVKTSGDRPYIVEQWQFGLVAVASIDFSPTLETDTFEYGEIRFLTYAPASNGSLTTTGSSVWSRATNSDTPTLSLP